MTRKASSKKHPRKPAVAQVSAFLSAEWSEAEPIAGQPEVDERTYDFRAAIAELAELGIAELARMGFKTTESNPRFTRERTLLELFDLCRTRGFGVPRISWTLLAKVAKSLEVTSGQAPWKQRRSAKVRVHQIEPKSIASR